MTYDLKITGATVIDGTGAAPVTADVAITNGMIVDVGRLTGAAKEEISAGGTWLTPGFIDIHTHYDGQVSWDDCFVPSVFHGVTTCVMGNCGVGFAPVRRGEEDRLIKLMEGVEDIPGSALAEGIKWGWESFAQYMDVLDATPRTMDYLVQVPHDPLRMFVMGSRAEAHELATPDDIAAMRTLLAQALQAGAAGFSTGRSDNHRTAEGKATPASMASIAELMGIAQAFGAVRHGVVQVVSDFHLLRGAGQAAFDAEFDVIDALAQACGRPLSLTWQQRDPGGEQFRAIQARVEQGVARGLPLYMQCAARGIGVILGLDASFHPFIGFPSYRALAHLPLAERAAAMRSPAVRSAMLAEQSGRLAGDGSAIPPLVDIMLARIELISARMFPLAASQGALPNYEPTVSDSFYVRAKQQGASALAAIYDYLCADGGDALIYFPIFNYNDGSLDTLHGMLQHPRALLGLSDAGAHVGTVCDASFPTFMLSHWVQGRQNARLELPAVVQMLTQRNAQYLGLTDRGVIAPGMRADLNLIDPARLALPRPELRRDLPAGGKRFVQKADGYIASYVRGVAVQQEGVVTEARPGRLVRMGVK
jgi:N-acyl-D-aspartate/D-glutamate deacylase